MDNVQLRTELRPTPSGMDRSCWACDGAIAHYQNPCPHCNSKNPNVDWEGAQKEMEARCYG